MTDDTTTTPVETTTAPAEAAETKAAPKADTTPKKEERPRNPRGGRGRKPRRGGDREPKEFEESILQIDRVTRVTRGGRQLRFRISVVIGDKKGRVGFGIGKSGEVLAGITKAVADAKKNLINVKAFNETIPHTVEGNFKATKVTLMPAQPGTGVIAGGSVRKILDLSGVQNVLSKMHGSRNAINAAHATFNALGKLEQKAPHSPKKKEVAEEETKEVKKAAPKKPAAKKPAAKKAAPKTAKKTDK